MCKVMEDMRNQTLLEGIREGRKEGIKEGRKKGMQEGMREVANRMLLEGKYSLEEIVNLTQLSQDEIKNLQAGQRG